MQDHRRAVDAPGANVMPISSEASVQASQFLRRLAPFVDTGSVGPASLMPMTRQAGKVQAKPLDSAPAAASEPAASIVQQAVAVLGEEMARGVLAARAGAAPAQSAYAAYPMLRQLHEFVDNLGALWPSLQGGAPAVLPSAAAGSEAEPLARLKPRASVRPGERASISMRLRNSESRAVRLVPAATDLLGSQGGRIPGSLLEFSPREIALDPQEQKELVISATVPTEAVPGSYCGLLVVGGLDYLRALVTIEVTGPAAAPPVTRGPSTAAGAGLLGSPASCAPGPVAAGAATGGLLQEAARLTEDGELGNSDAIRLLQVANRPEDIQEVLARYDKLLTREARSKLTLGAFVPLPGGVANQRYEPIFDRYPISGRTYTTASGTVVLNEVQYYNGEMVQLHGGCTNVEAVRQALAGSGFKPMTLRRSDGRESAIVQFWSHQLTDTSLRPYNAMFIIVVAVGEGTPASQSCIEAGDNEAASLLAMLDGRFDPGRRSYENKASLYFARLLDSTQVAVEVGRERMGTDKRPGTIELAHEGPRRIFSVRNGAGQAVARIQFVPTGDPASYSAELARAAATAGIALPDLPSGTECIYPGVARIGNGPVSLWDWRTDVAPRFQRVEPDTAWFGAGSEEGSMLIGWGFEPKALGYIPNVRGVVNGLA